MKKIYLTLILSIIFHMGYGQSIDQEKMNKDLEVAKNVLATMIQQESSNRFFFRNSDNISARYINDYGVVFTVENRFPQLAAAYGLAGSGAVKEYVEAEKVMAQKDKEMAQKSDKVREDMKEKSAMIAEELAREKARREVELERSADRKREEAVIITDAEAPEIFTVAQLKDNDDGTIKTAFVRFLKDYTTMIRQLRPSDKVMIKTSSMSRGLGELIIAGMGKARPVSNLSIEAVKKDLDDYASGKLNDSQLEKKLVIRESTTDVEKEPEIEIFSSVFNRLYQSDLSDTYYLGNAPWYERIEGVGLTYYLKYYSSVEGDGFYYMPTLDRERVSSEERNKIVNDLYPAFLEGLKENMLEYGHLLKNLKDNETLSFHVDLTRCDDCEMPKEIEVSVKKSVINQYRSEKLSLSQAKTKISVIVIKE